MSSKIDGIINDITDPQTRRAVKAMYDEMASVINNHTHNADGSETGSYYTSKPRTNAEGVSAGDPAEI